MVDAIVPRPIVTRQQAKALGLTRYFTGKPCIHGHLCDRVTLDQCCVECKRANYRRWLDKNPDKAKAATARWIAENHDYVLAKAAQWRADNPDRHKQYFAKWYADAENRARHDARIEEWRATNGDRMRQSYAVWYAANKHKGKAWAAANRDKRRAIDHARRSRKRSADGRYTDADLAQLMDAQGGRCAYCRRNIRKLYHVDHVVALSKGGTNWPANLQLTCGPCNQRKASKDPIRFAQELGLLL